MRGLYRGSLRASATKSNTSSTGRLMTISPEEVARPLPGDDLAARAGFSKGEFTWEWLLEPIGDGQPG